MKIYIWVGLNVQDVRFDSICGAGATFGLVDKGKVNIHAASASVRKMIEEDMHPRNVVKKLKRDIEWCKDNWDLHISTHSQDVVNYLGELIDKQQVSADDVVIYILSDDNSKIEHECTYDSEGYLKAGWPAGFFDGNWNE